MTGRSPQDAPEVNSPEEDLGSPEGVDIFAQWGSRYCVVEPALQGRRRGGTGRVGVKEKLSSTVREPTYFSFSFARGGADTVCFFFALYLI